MNSVFLAPATQGMGCALRELLLAAPTHRLSVQEVAARLWLRGNALAAPQTLKRISEDWNQLALLGIGYDRGTGGFYLIPWGELRSSSFFVASCGSTILS